MEKANKSKVVRDEKGRLISGVLNPEGRGSATNPWQPYGVRSKHWLNKLTRGELISLASDEDRLNDLSSYDAMIVVHLARTILGDDIGKERDRLLNRTEGMPVQTIQSMDISAPSPEELTEMTDEEAAVIFEKELKN